MSDKTVAFITGGNRGIGFETARQLGQRGLIVVIGSRDAAKGEEAAKTLRGKNHDVRSIKFDVLDMADLSTAYDYFDKEFRRLDILVNNAGIGGKGLGEGEYRRASQAPSDILHKVLETNFFAPVIITQTLLPLIRKSEAGRIVNVSSRMGSLTLHSDPDSPVYNKKTFPYNVSKTALNNFTIHLAHELKDTPMKVNAAHPGWVKTDMGGEQATMELAEGAKTIVDLATLLPDGPTGGFFHLGKPLPW